MVDAEIGTRFFAFKQHYRIAIPENRVVDLLSFLGPDVGNEFWSNLKRIEHVVSKYLNERHDHRILGRLFRLDHVFGRGKPRGQRS